MWKYVIKRVALAAVSLFVIATVCFMLVRALPMELPSDKNMQEIILARWEALGYDKPLLVQYGIYLKNVFTAWDFGTSWQISYLTPAWQVITDRLLSTVLVNLYALLFSVPIGLLLGTFAALKKNRWQDHLVSTGVSVFVSIPSYVYGFLMQYVLYSLLNAFPLHVYSLADAGGSYFTWKMFYSMIPPVLALSFGEIAGLCRFTRAELTEALVADYMLFAKAKGLTNRQATFRHAFKNAMVPILPMIISSFALILGGSLVIEQIFSIPGVGQLYVKSINLRDYDVFMANSIFYTFVGLFAGILVDVSYGFLDPRIRMGEK
ncbi:MAG: ABC transporter permease [Clostridia bacterium]|nr:ABC transporter permease [Clostridia bacterium]